MPKSQIELYRRQSTYYLRDANGNWYLRIQPYIPGTLFTRREAPRWVRYDVMDKDMTHFRHVNYAYSPNGKTHRTMITEWTASSVGPGCEQYAG